MSVLQLRDILLFGVPVVMAASTLGWMHWYPWNKGVKELDRIPAYTYGTAVVVGMPVLAMLVAQAIEVEMGQLFWAAHLLVNTVVCGMTVRVAYWIDGNRAIGLEDNDANHH